MLWALKNVGRKKHRLGEWHWLRIFVQNEKNVWNEEANTRDEIIRIVRTVYTIQV